ncbi:Crp/Fnr family transcriptional regulator [Pseudosulfitobacter koreensis]|uniref:Crp/Fnr family transcriptional regulator n=1 Tax=Pseudosulfitobacter koreensis TaxID=2968472 RepID=A0ABT1Z0K8_9RHOB|nr:Crp/Fnr family transcriptional regulator [Pseudosulfitobacter koreense]MCR8826683.1 Crp/Fnr family transcriptional regulator [Pseudosulfitobacter koreense]
MSHPADRKTSNAQVPAAISAGLSRLNVAPLSVAAGTDFQHEGDEAETVYLVESGWVASYTDLNQGQRQILYLHQAGDIAGFADLGSKTASCSLRSQRDCVLFPIPISKLQSPEFLSVATITALFQKYAQMQCILMRTLATVGRMEARHRVVWLILMLHDRVVGDSGDQMFEIPLNQSEIGDFLGLTNVSVSKMFSRLAEEGYIERKGRKILVRRLADMQKMIGYQNVPYRPEAMFAPVQAHTGKSARNRALSN